MKGVNPMSRRKHTFDAWGALLAVFFFAVVVFGVFGGGIFLRTIPTSHGVATTYFGINGFLALVLSFMLARTVRRFWSHWSSQERGWMAGLSLMSLGVGVAYMSRLSLEANVITVGTPLITAGIVILLNVMFIPSERLTQVEKLKQKQAKQQRRDEAKGDG